MKKAEMYILLISILLIALWIPVAYEKIADFSEFRKGLTKQLLPPWSVGMIAFLLPFLESIAVILLLYNKIRHYGFWLSFFLTTAFTLYVGGLLLLDKQDRPCVCGSVISWMSWTQHLIFNIFCMLTSGIGVLLSIKLQRSHYEGIVVAEGRSAKKTHKKQLFFPKTLTK